MKSINSAEILGKVVVGAPVAPRHTEAGHETCAYHRDYDEERNRMVYRCEHWAEPVGALYSEDAWNLARRLFQAIDADHGSWAYGDEKWKQLKELLK